MNHTFIYIIISVIIMILLTVLRFKVVVAAAEEWSYKVRRFERYCWLHGLYIDHPELNRLNNGEVFVVFLMIWKCRPRYFFSHTKDFKEIDHLIQINLL